MPELGNLRKKLLKNSKFLRNELNKINISTGNSNSHIIPIILGDEKKCYKLQNYLHKKNFFVKVIKSPTVAKKSERIRISLTATLKKKTLIDFLNIIKEFKD